MGCWAAGLLGCWGDGGPVCHATTTQPGMADVRMGDPTPMGTHGRWKI